MDSNIVLTNKETRKVLGNIPTKCIQNKIDKLVSYHSKYSFKKFKLYHIENLLNIDFLNLNPADYIQIFKLLNNDLYYNQKIYYSLYKSIYEKIPYFNFDELIKLIEFIVPSCHIKGKLDVDYNNFNYNNYSDPSNEDVCSQPTIFSTSNIDLYQIQKDILIQITKIIDNKLKLKSNITNIEVFKLHTDCLNSLNRLSFINSSNTQLELCYEIINFLYNKLNGFNLLHSDKISFDHILSSLNYVSDTISIKCIDLICNYLNYNKEASCTTNEFSYINSSIFECRELLLNYFTKGDIQILKFILDILEELNLSATHNIKSETISEIQRLCKLTVDFNDIYNILNQHDQNHEYLAHLNSHISNCFKILYSSKFLKVFDKTIFNNIHGLEDLYNNTIKSIARHFHENINRLNHKTQAVLLSLICEYQSLISSKLTLNKDSLQHNDLRNLDSVRNIIFTIPKYNQLSLFDYLNVCESSYKAFGYVNHYSTKKIFDRVFNQYPKNKLDAIVILRFLFFTSKFPFAVISSENKNIKMALEYIEAPEDIKTNFNFKRPSYNINTTHHRRLMKNICQFDNVLRDTHNIKSSKLYNSYYAAKDIVKYFKRIKYVAINVL